MKFYRYLLVASALLALPACSQEADVNKTDGVKDALDARPHEGIRDAGEDIEEGVKDAGEDIKEAVEDK